MVAFRATGSKEPVHSETHHTHLLWLLTCTTHRIKTSLSFSIRGRQHDSTFKDYCKRIRADGAAGIIVINDGLSSECRSVKQRACFFWLECVGGLLFTSTFPASEKHKKHAIFWDCKISIDWLLIWGRFCKYEAVICPYGLLALNHLHWFLLLFSFLCGWQAVNNAFR